MPRSESVGANDAPESSRPDGATASDVSEASTTPAPDAERASRLADERPAEKPLDALQQARDLVASGELSAALTTLRALVAREPTNPHARAALAGLLEKRGDLEGALGELGRALESAPDDVAILCARAALFTTRGRYDQAELDLRRAAKAQEGSGSAEVQVQLGVLFSKRARWREAIEPLRAAVEADPERADAHYHLGEAYNHIDDLPAALAAYEAAATLQPTNTRALKGVGIVLDRLGRPTEAAAAYRRARDAQRR